MPHAAYWVPGWRPRLGTAFYMWRMFDLTFLGQRRGPAHDHHAHESAPGHGGPSLDPTPASPWAPWPWGWPSDGRCAPAALPRPGVHAWPTPNQPAGVLEGGTELETAPRAARALSMPSPATGVGPGSWVSWALAIAAWMYNWAQAGACRRSSRSARRGCTRFVANKDLSWTSSTTSSSCGPRVRGTAFVLVGGWWTPSPDRPRDRGRDRRRHPLHGRRC